jgi:SAM-dependent methyltransferase
MNLNTDKEILSSTNCVCCGGSVSMPWMTVPDRVTPWIQHTDQLKEEADSYDLLRCSSCLHVWLDNRPTPERMSYYYGPQYHQAIGSSGEASPERWTRQLQIISKYKTGGDILDVGCSSGGFLSSLKGGPWKLYGIEASLPTAERARSLTGADVFAGDVADARFPPNSFDVVTCSDVLEHLYEPREIFQKISNWLKPGGVFYVFVPNIMSWEAQMFRSYWWGLDLPRHLHHFSVGSLTTLAKSVGLCPVRMVTPRGSYLEHSTSLLLDGLLRKAGVKRAAPLNLNGEAGIGWKVARKGIRLSIEALYSTVASTCGAGPSVQAIFQKSDKLNLAAGDQSPDKLVKTNTSSANQPQNADIELSVR